MRVRDEACCRMCHYCGPAFNVHTVERTSFSDLSCLRRAPDRSEADGSALWPRTESNFWCGEYAYDGHSQLEEASK